MEETRSLVLRLNTLEKKNKTLIIVLTLFCLSTITLSAFVYHEYNRTQKNLFRNIEVDNIYLNKTIWFKSNEGREAGWIGMSPGGGDYGFLLFDRDSAALSMTAKRITLSKKPYQMTIRPYYFELSRIFSTDYFERTKENSVYISCQDDKTGIRILKKDSLRIIE